MTLAAADTPFEQSRNHLLARLPHGEFETLRPLLTTVRLASKQSLAEPSQPITFAYFPPDTVISMSALDAAGGSVEVGSVGCEGLAGLPILLGTDRAIGRMVAQIGGDADRVEAPALHREVHRLPELRRMLLLYTQAFMTQVAQSTACNRLHSAERRLARWLLICRDRLGRDDLPITHETIAHMLGVRRATVTEAAGDLQQNGMIRYRRGVVTILRRERLEMAACECYRIVRAEFDRLLGVRVG
ncbi:MAG TPA: Crp/Fnr family transcriptional regulator [Gemmatimonadales bacterium]|nr:Crp/Fnr family transcriptional regulator [Gemmatimonadales bacterium]